MNFRLMFVLAVMACLSGTLPCAQAASAENPYTPIVTRNIFGLVPIPDTPPPVTTPATPPPKITANGIMTIFGKLQALFKVAVVAKPGQPAKEESYIMGVGERQDDIEVQKIDEKAAIITFNNHGTIQELPLIVGTATGGEPAPAGAAGQPGLPMPRPEMAPGAGGNTPPIEFGGRFGRNYGTGNGNLNPNGGPGLGGGRTTAMGNANTTEPLSPEARVIMMEAQRARWLKEGNPAAAIIPPTPITQEVIGGGQPAGGGPPVP